MTLAPLSSFSVLRTLYFFPSTEEGEGEEEETNYVNMSPKKRLLPSYYFRQAPLRSVHRRGYEMRPPCASGIIAFTDGASHPACTAVSECSVGTPYWSKCMKCWDTVVGIGTIGQWPYSPAATRAMNMSHEIQHGTFDLKFEHNLQNFLRRNFPRRQINTLPPLLPPTVIL